MSIWYHLFIFNHISMPMLKKRELQNFYYITLDRQDETSN